MENITDPDDGFMSVDDITFKMDNVTSEQSAAPPGVPIDTLFYVIHGCAITSLNISNIVSAATLVYLTHSGHQEGFWRRRFSERVVVYIAVMDLLHG